MDMNKTQQDPLRFLKPRRKNFHLTPTKPVKSKANDILSHSMISSTYDAQIQYKNDKQTSSVAHQSQSDIPNNEITKKAQHETKKKEFFIDPPVPSHQHFSSQSSNKVYNPLNYFSPQVEAFLLNLNKQEIVSLQRRDRNDETAFKTKPTIESLKVNMSKQPQLKSVQSYIQSMNKEGNKSKFSQFYKQNRSTNMEFSNYQSNSVSTVLKRNGSINESEPIMQRKKQKLKISQSQIQQNDQAESDNALQHQQYVYEPKQNDRRKNLKRQDDNGYSRQCKDLEVTEINQQETFNLQEQAGESVGQLKQCQICSRKFNPNSYEKHARICEKVFFKKRRQFSSQKQRSQSKNKK